MKDQETREKFLRLRAQGRSFHSIAEELGVAKQTLVNWSHEMAHELQNLQQVELEALRERYALTERTRIESLGEQLRRTGEEVAKRDLSALTTDQLLRVDLKLLEMVAQEPPPVFQRVESLYEVDYGQLETWQA